LFDTVGGWALLVALLEASQSLHFKGYLSKKDLVNQAQNWCDTSFKVSIILLLNLFNKESESHYTAWSSMSTLLKHQLVYKEKKPAQFSLTSSGNRLAKTLYENRFQVSASELPVKETLPYIFVSTI
jgi:crossover junction endonuclease MUS81